MMKAMHYTLEQLNAMSTDAFVAALSGIFEHSPWVAEAAAAARPFGSIDALHGTMKDAVEAAGDARQLALINAHPELAGKAAVRGELTAESTREQSGAGLDRCTQAEFDRLQQLNRAYREEIRLPVHSRGARLRSARHHRELRGARRPYARRGVAREPRADLSDRAFQTRRSDRRVSVG